MDKPKKCIVCGMPLQKESDYPSGDTTKDYCKYCGTKDGIHPYNKLVEGMSNFIEKSQKLKGEEAKQKAKEMIDNSEAAKMGRIPSGE